MILVRPKTMQERAKKNRVTKSLADHFLTALPSILILLALRSASTSFNKSNSIPFFFSSSTHLPNNFQSSFSLSRSFSRWVSTSVLYRTAHMTAMEKNKEQRDGTHDFLQAVEFVEEMLKRRRRERE